MTDKPTPEGDRIAKRLARAGVASRREAERMIEAGRVRVNGRRIDSPALNVTQSDKIEVDGELIAEDEPPRLWRYHKPTGLVTSASDEKGRDTVFDKLPPDLPRVMSIGRLDLNSEGLLLLTNDGALKRKLELPSTGWTRRYRARAHGRIEDKALEPIRKGITVEGEHFQPMEVEIERQQGANVWLTVALKEGKNREIRRALEAVGLVVNRLIRVSYGPFQLGDLPAGGVDEIKAKILRDQLGVKDAPEPVRAKAKPLKRGGTGQAVRLAPKSERGGDKPAPRNAPTGKAPTRSGPPKSGREGGNPRGGPRGPKRG
jgi:23S rRNA pseudouridine2605 synthase